LSVLPTHGVGPGNSDPRRGPCLGTEGNEGNEEQADSSLPSLTSVNTQSGGWFFISNDQRQARRAKWLRLRRERSPASPAPIRRSGFRMNLAKQGLVFQGRCR